VLVSFPDRAGRTAGASCPNTTVADPTRTLTMWSAERLKQRNRSLARMHRHSRTGPEIAGLCGYLRVSASLDVALAVDAGSAQLDLSEREGGR
jgi:hypothetical protein